MDELQHKVAVITGAASGIGRASAMAFARRGTCVVLADIDLDGARATASLIADAGGNAFAFACDVGEDDAFEKLRDATLDHFGAVHIVMNNAGGITRGLPENIPLHEWTRIFNLNLLSVVRSIHAFVPLLKEQGEGHIVNTASFAGLYSYSFDRMPYAASKAAVVQISEGLQLYLKPFGVQVTCLCPGPVATGIMRQLRSFGPQMDVWGPGEQFEFLEADTVGELVVEAVRTNRFMAVTHPAVRDLLIQRAEDWDAFLDQIADNPHVALKAPGKQE